MHLRALIIVLAAGEVLADATSPVSGPARDATLAGSTGLRVMVPKNVADGDRLDELARAIDREVKAARKTKPSAPVAIYADTTIDYGCLCPPFVFAPFWNSGRQDSYVLPIFADGVPDAQPAKQGVYRFAGHFDGRRITGFDWLKLRGEKPRASTQHMPEYARTAPVFIVEGWCFEPAESFADDAAKELYGSALKQIAERGRFCPGSKFPADPRGGGR